MARRRSIGSIVIDVEARTARLEADLKKTQTMLRGHSRKMETSFASLGSGIGRVSSQLRGFYAIAAGSGLTQAARSAIDYASRLTDAAEATQTNVVALQVLLAASRDAGAKQEQLQQALIKSGTNAQLAAQGGQEMAKQFRALNIDVDAFARLQPERRLEELGKAYLATENKGAAMLAVTRILGEEAGPKLLEVIKRLGKDGFQPLARELGEVNLFLSDIEASKLDKIADDLGRVSVNMQVAISRIVLGLDKARPVLEKIQALYDKISPFGMMMNALNERMSGGNPDVPAGDDDPGVGAALLGVPTEAELRSMQTRAEAISRSVMTEVERAAQERQELIDLNYELRRAGMGDSLPAEFFRRKLEELNKIENGSARVREITDELNMTFASAFEDAIVNGEKFGDVLKSLEKDLLRLLIRKTITEPLFNSVGGFFSGLFGGGKASGGPVSRGTAYLVGEQGPELFVPSHAGGIVPNHALGGGGDSVTVNNNFQTGVTRHEVAALIPRIVNASLTASVDARKRRKGGFR